MTVDTALVLIFAMYQGDALSAFVAREDTQCNIEQCAAVLTAKHKHHVRLCVPRLRWGGRVVPVVGVVSCAVG